MTAATKQRRVKLGGVQRQVLTLLAVQKAETERLGMGRDAGLTAREIMAEMYGYVLFGSQQWLPSVLAQAMLERRERGATSQLFDATVRAVDQGRKLVETLLRRELSEDATETAVIESNQLLRHRLINLEMLNTTLRQFAPFIHSGSDWATEAALFPIVLDQARQLAALLRGIPGAPRAIQKLPVGHEAQAEGVVRLGSQHASLSRALRVLREHELIEKREVTGHWSSQHIDQTELRFYITETGLARLGTSDNE